MLRFFDPQKGRILLGGRDLRDLTLSFLRRHIAVVAQDTYLFYGTVAENLRLAKPQATQQEIEAAARAANAHDFIMALPNGYETVVGERGARLSGGERQRSPSLEPCSWMHPFLCSTRRSPVSTPRTRCSYKKL